METLVLFSIVALGAALWWLLRKRPPAPRKAPVKRAASGPTARTTARTTAQPAARPAGVARQAAAPAGVAPAEDPTETVVDLKLAEKFQRSVTTGTADTIVIDGPFELEESAMPALLQGFELVGPETLSTQQRDELTAQLGALPMPPRSMRELISPEFMANAATREFTELVMREPLLAAKIISRVNSAFYGLSSPIVSVAHAVAYLGMNTVRNLALQFALEQSFAEGDPELEDHQARLFDAGTIAADLVTLLGPKLGIRDVGALSTQAVLSFLGDFAMPGLMPHGVATANWPLGLLERSCTEQMTLGVAAPAVGEMLMTEWELPATFITEQRGINQILVTPPSPPLASDQARRALCYACARVAEQIALGRAGDLAKDLLAGDNEHYAEFYYLRAYLAHPPLAALPGLLRSPESRQAIHRLAAGVKRRREAGHQSDRVT